MLTLMYITIYNKVHAIGSKESKDAHSEVYYNIQYSTFNRVKESKDAHFDVYYSIQYSTLNKVKRVKRCSHTITGFNFTLYTLGIDSISCIHF